MPLRVDPGHQGRVIRPGDRGVERPAVRVRDRPVRHELANHRQRRLWVVQEVRRQAIDRDHDDARLVRRGYADCSGGKYKVLRRDSSKIVGEPSSHSWCRGGDEVSKLGHRYRNRRDERYVTHKRCNLGAGMETVQAIEAAVQAISSADAMLIGAGAGMGVDSGLPDFRGNEGFWKAYPPFKGK